MKDMMKDIDRKIYERLGNLFYAFGAEQHLPRLASGEFKMLLNRDWPTGSGAVPSDHVPEATHLMALTIDSLQSESFPAAQAYRNFERFYRANRDRFPPTLRRNIIEMVQTINAVFGPPGAGKDFCDRLETLFHEAPVRKKDQSSAWREN